MGARLKEARNESTHHCSGRDSGHCSGCLNRQVSVMDPFWAIFIVLMVVVISGLSIGYIWSEARKDD